MIKVTHHPSKIDIFNADCRDFLKSLPDNSIDLIATDPPYFRVKEHAWDNQWADEIEFLAWLDSILLELWRVLKPTGSLYLFCSAKMAARVETLIAARFNVLSHIVWRKENGTHKRHRVEGLRSFCSQTERIIFAEHYGAAGAAKGDSGYAKKCARLKRDVFQPLIDYFKTAKKRSGISSAEINAATQTKMATHWFSSSQWSLPSQEQYEALQKLFSGRTAELNRNYSELTENFSTLHQSYLELRERYDHLRVEYENHRRAFKIAPGSPHTDVWGFDVVQYYKGKHPCEKPLALMEHIVRTSSREGMTVLDCFMGSGSTAKACINLNRSFIGVEFDKEIFNQTSDELALYSERVLKTAA